MKKIVSLLLAVSILASVFVGIEAPVFAADPSQFSYTENGDGTVTLTGFSGVGGDVELPAELDGMPVTGIAGDAFRSTDAFGTVTIPGSIKEIGDYAFILCRNLTAVTIGDGVERIGNFAFDSCAMLSSITVPGSVKEIGDYAFGECDSLTTATICEGVTRIIDSAFRGCDKLYSITIPGSVKEIGGYAFEYCDSLTELTIGDGVETIGKDAFVHCGSLLTVTIPDSVTSIGERAFGFYYDNGYHAYEGFVMRGTPGSEAERYATENGLTFMSTDGEYVVQPPADGFTFEPNGDGTVTLTKYNGAGGNVEVPAEHDGMAVTKIGDQAFDGCDSLITVTIPEGVTTIGYAAFQVCGSLTSVTIPSSVTSIGDYAFHSCGGLTEITVDPENPNYSSQDGVLFNKEKTELIHCPAGNTRTTYSIPDGVRKIGDHAFAYCDKLTTITIPDGVTEISNYAFGDCKSLTDMAIPESVTSIGNSAFCNCSELSSVNIPKGITKISHNMFVYCKSLTEITIPDGVTSVGVGAFKDCDSLTAVTIPQSVTSIDIKAFGYYGQNYKYDGFTIYGVSGSEAERYATENGFTFIVIGDEPSAPELEYEENGDGTVTVTKYNGEGGSVEIPAELDGMAVTKIGDMAFDGCEKLTEITIPDGVESIGAYAFRNCASLTTVTLPKSVTSIGDMAFGYYGEDSKYDGFTVCGVSGSVAEQYASENGLTFMATDGGDIEPPSTEGFSFSPNGDGTATVIGYGGMGGSVEIPAEYNGMAVTQIANYAFQDNTLITSIVIPNSITKMGREAFKDCTSLVSVTIPGSIAQIAAYAFSGCDSLTEVTIPEGVTTIGYAAFQVCDSLAFVTIPSSVTSIGDGAFYYCKSMTEITVDPENQNYSSQDGVLFNKDKTELIQYPAGNARTTYSIPDGVSEIGHYAFENSDKLTNVTVPDGVTSINSYAFQSCRSLTDMTLPESVTRISNDAFKYCSELSSINIPNGITTISDSTFAGCKSLTDITIPDSVTSIDMYAFFDCDSLTEVTIPDSVTSIGKMAFGYYGQSKKYDGFTIYGVSGSAAEQYAVDNGFMFISTGEPPTIMGDVNGDGSADTFDALMIAQFDAGGAALDGDSRLAADVNGDGSADTFDALMIARYDAGEITEF